MTQWGLDNLFNPGKRHMDDEKRRLQSTREEVGDSSGGRRIDLDGGKVSISLPRPPRVSEPEPAEVSEDGVEAAPEVVDEPELALANDEAEIEPAVQGPEADEPEALAEPPAPAAPQRRLSANAWSRRG